VGWVLSFENLIRGADPFGVVGRQYHGMREREYDVDPA
jgi:hypothetical protein